ncbi:MAG: tRNA (N6-threonylcarbamoyladenosine(37)-N6)-methyltransferase TrmO [Calothrix sp. SM1_5_4]|nr:tRNA (N6-threonylcarbamoyladenosine(37)-N6)-methyltransferase TrmO [Calothrix sp. SM1_5_4]
MAAPARGRAEMIPLSPIGIFRTRNKYPYEARRQAAADSESSEGEILLHPGRGFEQALEDLDGFERIWIIYQFHHNDGWKPKVMPPRGPRQKRGVFATRAPYRPNPLGLSCVRLVKVEGLRLLVEGHDLLDETPVLDIKPYLPYADAFPEARVGWLENIEAARWRIEFSKLASEQIAWLEARGVPQLRGFIRGQLEFEPLDRKRKRLSPREGGYRLSYRTWRVDFNLDQETRIVQIESIKSGYSKTDLNAADDPYEDKELHRRFATRTFTR